MACSASLRLTRRLPSNSSKLLLRMVTKLGLVRQSFLSMFQSQSLLIIMSRVPFRNWNLNMGSRAISFISLLTPWVVLCLRFTPTVNQARSRVWFWWARSCWGTLEKFRIMDQLCSILMFQLSLSMVNLMDYFESAEEPKPTGIQWSTLIQARPTNTQSLPCKASATQASWIPPCSQVL